MMPKKSFTIQQLVRIPLLATILFLAQLGFSSIPGELVSLLIILYTLIFGKETFWSIILFILLEGVHWGFGLWWFSYWYVWISLYLLVLLLNKLIASTDFIMWSIISGLFGLIFGALFAIAYIPISSTYALTYWVAGLPWDLGHAITNFIFMLIVGKPLYRILLKVKVLNN